MFQALSHFRGREADGVRGDPGDSILTYAPDAGLVMNMEDGRVITLEGGIFNSSANQNEIFVYCLSDELSHALADKFGRFCVEIPDPDILVRRLRARANLNSKFDYGQVVCGSVDYRQPNREPGIDWALPQRLVLIKPLAFAWQKEFRIALGTRNAMNVENVNLTIQTAPVHQAFHQVPAPVFLRVGNLANLATLHRF